MATDEIPDDVRRFLSEHIESYEQLEILVLLQKQPGSALTSAAVAATSSLPESAAEVGMTELHRSGLLERRVIGNVAEFRYRPQSQDTVKTVEHLVKTYRESPIQIVKLMNANAIERVRTSAMRAFANAFVLDRRNKKDG